MQEAYVQSPDSTGSLRSGPIESEVPTHARRRSNRSDDGRQDGDDDLYDPFPREILHNRSSFLFRLRVFARSDLSPRSSVGFVIRPH